MKATILTVGAVILGSSLATTAGAQEVKGDTTVTAQAGAAPVSSTASTPIAAKVEDDSPDHERFIGHFAVGYFGISQIPIAAGGAGGITQGNVNAPIIGMRYWFQRNLGIDAGIGFGMSGGSHQTVTGNTTTDTDHQSNLAFALHGGVPIAFAEGHHYVFELVPEATIGFASGTIKGAPNPGGAANPDTDLSGFRLDLGARVGAEIHFGFIGVPELALEASVGLYVRRTSVKAKTGNNSESDGTTTITTSVGADPWALFVNNISALYYF